MAADALTHCCAVLGHPIGHSLSPALHTAGYRALGLTDWSYEAIDCSEADLAGRFAGFGAPWRGLSLTMPLKRAVMPMLAEISSLATAVGAVNTVVWEGPERRPRGDNTDVYGIVAALGSVGVRDVPGAACILGAGATAASGIAALAQLGCPEVLLLARSAARAEEALTVADRLGVAARVGSLDQVGAAVAAPVLVSTLPADAAAAWARTVPAGARPGGALLDVTYHPWPTALATVWERAGGAAVGGLEMLLHQATAQFTLFTGEPAPVGAMRAALPAT